MDDVMTVEQLAEQDFVRARRRAFLRWIFIHLRGLTGDAPAGHLACFEEARRAGGSSRRGFETVGVEKIVGSVGRCRDFGPGFLPVCSCLGGRWSRIARAFREDKPLPPVELYKIGEEYFVLDGNHRVSVARYRGAVAVDAVVTEFVVPQVAPADRGRE